MSRWFYEQQKALQRAQRSRDRQWVKRQSASAAASSDESQSEQSQTDLTGNCSPESNAAESTCTEPVR